jgi:hypothetical protein
MRDGSEQFVKHPASLLLGIAVALYMSIITHLSLSVAALNDVNDTSRAGVLQRRKVPCAASRYTGGRARSTVTSSTGRRSSNDR